VGTGFSLSANEVRYAIAMHSLLIAVALFAQVSVTREAVVDPAAADKTHAEIHDALAPSARQKLEHAGAKVEIKTAREAVVKAFPETKLSADTIDALAFYVMSETSATIAAETKKITEQRSALLETMKAAGFQPKAPAKYALKISGDYATAPEQIPASAKPEEMSQRLAELAAMLDLNERAMKTANERRMSLLKQGHEITLNAIRNMK
jgi:hypothetical protein